MKAKSRIELEIKSLNQEKFFNKIIENNIQVFNIRRGEKTTFFKIESKYLAKIIAICKNNGIEILNNKLLGFEKFKNNFKSRIGISVGLVFCLIFCVFANFFILKIDIMGCEKLNKNEIYEFLNNEKIDVFSAKNSINIKKLQLKIMENFGQISLVSISQKGLTLIVNIKEKSENLTSFNNLDVISSFNGRIISIEVFSGTALVERGAIVKNGDVLVQGNTNESGQKTSAKAKIVAEIWIENSVNVPQTKIEMVKTGKKQQFREVSVWGKTLFTNLKDCKFENYEKTEQEITKFNLLLPIKIKNYIYEEIKNQEVFCDFDAQKEQIINNCRQNALQKVQKNDIIKNEKSSVSIIGETMNVVYVITLEREILWS